MSAAARMLAAQRALQLPNAPRPAGDMAWGRPIISSIPFWRRSGAPLAMEVPWSTRTGAVRGYRMAKGWTHRSLSGEAPGERRRAGPLSARVWCGWASAGTALRREWSWCEHVRDCGTPGRNAVFSLGRIPLRAPILPVQPRGGCGCRG